MGVYEVRKQTAVEQARDQFGDEAEEALQRWLEPLREHGGRLESRLVFSQAPLDTIERVGAEQDADAILVPRPLGEERITQVLVPVRGDVNAERIARFVTAVADEANADVLLLHVADPDVGVEERQDVLATFRQRFTEQGLPDDQLDWEVVQAEDPSDVIVDRAEQYHLVVMGESNPDDPEVVLGDLPRSIAKEIQRPVLVTRVPHAGHHGG